MPQTSPAEVRFYCLKVIEATSLKSVNTEAKELQVRRSSDSEKELLSYRNKNLRVERELLLKTSITDEEAEELYKRIKHCDTYKLPS